MKSSIINNKILFLTTAHHYNDDRIFYHQAKELLKQNFRVKICSLSSEFVGNIDGVEIESYSVLEKSVSQKIEILKKIIEEFQPNCIIASEPLAIFAAKDFKKNKKTSLVYDVTEWYPSMRMVSNFSFPKNLFQSIKFFMINLYAGFLSTHFIFGENTKKFPLAYIFPLKKFIVLPYFPDEKYIHTNVQKLEPNKIKVCYTGVFSKEKGIGYFFSAIDYLQKKKQDLEISILLIGASRREEDQVYFERLVDKCRFKNLEIRKPTAFEDFTKNYTDADICFDLREQNFENHHCLPIKLFYYAASGKPVIYTNLKAIKLHVTEIDDFGFLVNPQNAKEIADSILKYVENPKLYLLHANNARQAFRENYNWEKIKNSFTDFIRKSIS